MSNFVNSLWNGFSKTYVGVESWIAGLFQFSGRPLPIEAIADRIDPRFLPQAPMSGEQIDVSTRMEISQAGFKRARLVTHESHPELAKHWDFLCKRAGFTEPLQLILCDSDIPNAFAVSDSEMGFTTGLLQHLTYREVIAVLSHELGHANNFERQRGLHVASAGGMSALGVVLPIWGGSKAVRPELIDGIIAATAASSIGSIGGSKITGYSSELEADLEGAVISRDPDALISALTKLEGEVAAAPAWKRTLNKIFRVHPATEERVRWLTEIKQELDAKAPTDKTPQAAPTGPAPRIAGRDVEVERVSTNLSETAISGA